MSWWGDASHWKSLVRWPFVMRLCVCFYLQARERGLGMHSYGRNHKIQLVRQQDTGKTGIVSFSNGGSEVRKVGVGDSALLERSKQWERAASMWESLGNNQAEGEEPGGVGVLLEYRMHTSAAQWWRRMWAFFWDASFFWIGICRLSWLHLSTGGFHECSFVNFLSMSKR